MYRFVLGDVWPPIVQCFMGTEQLLLAYNKVQVKRRSDVLVLASVIFTVGVVVTGYILAFSSRFDGNVKYFCGRKATFGRKFSGFVYAHNVLGYVSGVVLNSIALQRIENEAKSLYEKSECKDRRILHIRSCLIVSTISTILVSIPNCLSLFSLLIISVKDSISKPAVWATCVNSGVNLFVYFILDRDFRRHVLFLWKREKYDTVSEEQNDNKEDKRENRHFNQCESGTVASDSVFEQKMLILSQ
ncbi:hypothetical protein RB195_001473 [Necator americanus]|uniref:G-protein coupled receptors family 1 profile domain-containing protein n=2 Tax=Necator americanus TaxID=51031 RepID=A0ABR1DHF0_NECAM